MANHQEASQVPFLDLKTQYETNRASIDEAIKRVLNETDFVLGESVERFEQEFASYCSATHGIGCANGTDALELVLEAAGIGRGDEVITVSHTFSATVSPIIRAGATPVLVDVEEETLLMNPDALAAAVTERTAAIIVVHLYGSMVPMEPILNIARRKNLLIIEDAAQAHGATWQGKRAGSVGHVSTFSFYPGKNLGAYGDGGIVLTSDRSLAHQLALLRDHGKSSKYVHEVVGRNSRLDSLQAAVLAVKLSHLDNENEARRSAYDYYASQIKSRLLLTKLVKVPEESVGVHHLCVAKVQDRRSLISEMNRAGIATGIHYPVPIHLQPGFMNHVRVPDTLSMSEKASGEILSLPIFPTIAKPQQDRVLDMLVAHSRTPAGESPAKQ